MSEGQHILVVKDSKSMLSRSVGGNARCKAFYFGQAGVSVGNRLRVTEMSIAGPSGRRIFKTRSGS